MIFWPGCSTEDNHNGVRGQGGHADAAASGRQGAWRHVCGGQFRECKNCSGVSEAAADPNAAEKGCVQGLPLQHRDVLRPREFSV